MPRYPLSYFDLVAIERRRRAQAIEAFGQDAKRLDGEATKARSEGCAK